MDQKLLKRIVLFSFALAFSIGLVAQLISHQEKMLVGSMIGAAARLAGL